MREPIVYLLWSDLVGVTRTRGVPRSAFGSKLETGFGWACAGQALTPFEAITDNPWGPMDEVRQIPDGATLFSYASTSETSAWDAVICDSKTAPGVDWDCCVRTFYRHALADLEAETGLSFAASFEHEFLVEGDFAPETPFSFAAARRGNAFLQACAAALRSADVVPESLEPEYGLGQYEISCAPKIGVAAADAALIAREIIRAVAADHGLTTSFTPKPSPEAVGNGAHIHFSLVDAEGENVTHDPAGPLGLSATAAHFAAGVLDHLDALVAVTAPTPVSYFRLGPHHWSCGFKAIGVQNREATLRVTPSASRDPAKQKAGYNIEYRPSDACASPYLSLGVIVRAGLDGIRRKLALPEAIDRDPADLSEAELAAKGITPLPTSLDAAVAAFRADTTVSSWFSPTLTTAFLALKSWESAFARDNDAATVFERYKRAY